MTESFTIWESDYLPSIQPLIKNKKYLLDKGIDVISSFIRETSIFHLDKKSIVFDESIHYIEFGIETESSKFITEYNRKIKSTPELTILVFIEDVKYNPLVLTDIDIESYKYKDIKPENSFCCIFPEKNCQIVFDSSKYYGFYTMNQENIAADGNKFLKINVQTKVNSQIEGFIPSEENSEEKCKFDIISKEMERKEETVAYKNMINILLYDEKKNIDVLNKILLANPIGVVKINNTTQNFVGLEFLQENYGEVAVDLYQFINREIEVCDLSGNRFSNNKIIQNILSKDVCYWIINESEKLEWGESGYPNFPTYLPLDKIPSVLNFILFVSNYWLTEIKKVFNCQIVDFNISDIFVSKYTKENIDEVKNKDGKFLTLSIALNDEIDYTEGGIIFDDIDEKIVIHQGDMLMYTGKKSRTKGGVSEGVKYILVLFIEIILSS